MITYAGIAIPELRELPLRPRGIVVHWTGGTRRANPVDLGAYHAVVNGDRSVVAGVPFALNMRPKLGTEYARHTGGYNTGRAGVAYAGMKDYAGRSRPGSHLIDEPQFEAGADFMAELCRVWDLDPGKASDLCTHREVWTIHRVRGTTNHTKTDIEYLPFRPDLGPDDVGPYIRARVASYLTGRRPHPEPTPAVDPKARSAVVEMPVLGPGDRTEGVRRLQLALGVTPVGNSGPSPFGPGTFAAVKAFQRSRGLTDDGIVGPETWRALFG